MAQQRGRTPSVGDMVRLRHTPSPSPHAGFAEEPDTRGVDPSLLTQLPASSYAGDSNHLFANQNMFFPTAADSKMAMDSLQCQSLPNQTFNQAQDYTQQNLFVQNDVSQMNGFSNVPSMQNTNFDGFENYNNLNDPFMNISMADLANDSQNVDPALFADTTLPNMQFLGTNNMQSAPYFSNTTPQSQHRQSLPQNTLQPAQTQNAGFVTQNDYLHHIHTHKDSLDPSSAAFPQFGQSADWPNALYQRHHRSSSDARSDISSAHASPFLGNTESLESIGQASPLLRGTGDAGLINDASLNFNQFRITDSHGDAKTPVDSPIISPVGATQMPATFFGGLGLGMSSLGMGMNGGTGFLQQGSSNNDSFPATQLNGHGDQGGYTEGTLSPPEINIEYAPPARQPTINEPSMNPFEQTLSPPDRGNAQPYAKSSKLCSYTLPKRDVSPMRGRSPSVGTGLMPHSPAPHSRSPSPASTTGEPAHKRRTSASSIPDRDRLLGLARNSPVTPPLVKSESSASPAPCSNTEGGKRAQKHPANFSCHLCDKRFTRAYNLRSHLRTHTDERPFVCTVCGKAFARQHDRKRHEGLHTGERKFVCYGLLKENAGTWGCKRRFARADALGRHFRSEAGRACIRPLLDEEAHERQTALMEEASQNRMNGGGGGLTGAGSTVGGTGAGSMSDVVLDVSRMPLPAALLQMYPALADIQWNALPMQQGGMDEGDFDGFDMSSGGEGFDEDDGYLSGNNLGGSGGWTGDLGGTNGRNTSVGGGDQGWLSDYGVK